jgi:hypothetical protein
MSWRVFFATLWEAGKLLSLGQLPSFVTQSKMLMAGKLLFGSHC